MTVTCNASCTDLLSGEEHEGGELVLKPYGVAVLVMKPDDSRAI